MLQAGGDAHRAELPSHSQEKPVHIPYPKPWGLDDWNSELFWLSGSSQRRSCIIPSGGTSHNKTLIFLQQIFTLRGIYMMVTNSFISVGARVSFDVKCFHKNIRGFQRIRTLEMRTYISPTRGKQTQEP